MLRNLKKKRVVVVLAALAALEADRRRLAGVVVGRALLDGRISLDEAVAACAAPAAAGE